VRFLKIIRLLRAFTGRDGNLYKEPMGVFRHQAVFHGLEALFSFVTGTGRYFMPFMWTSHVGSCVWYHLVKNYFVVIGMFWLSMDVVRVPCGLAWDYVGVCFSNEVSLLSVAFWSLDVILSFFMPYGRDGVNISDCRMASLHYVQRSFILDLLI
jgi:hypothetical protein